MLMISTIVHVRYRVIQYIYCIAMSELEWMSHFAGRISYLLIFYIVSNITPRCIDQFETSTSPYPGQPTGIRPLCVPERWGI